MSCAPTIGLVASHNMQYMRHTPGASKMDRVRTVCLILVMGWNPITGDQSSGRSALDRNTLTEELHKAPQSPQVRSSFLPRTRLLNVTSPLVSTECSADIQTYISAMSRLEDWALEMSDSFGDREAGTLDGNTIWEGMYDICHRVKPGLTGSDGKPYTLRYCSSVWAMFGTPLIPASLGVCLPSSCGASDLFGVYRDLIPQDSLPYPYPDSVNLTRNTCAQKKDINQDPAVFGAISVLAFFGLMAVIGTLYDVITLPKRKVPKEKSASKPTTNGIGRPVAISTQEHFNEAFIHTEGTFKRIDVDIVSPNGVTGIDTGILKDDIPKANGVHSNGGLNMEINQLSKDTAKGSQLAVESQRPKAYKPNSCEMILLSFSVYTNIPKLTTFDHVRGSYRCLNGLRFLAMVWIILGHTWELGLQLSEAVSPILANRITFYTVLRPRTSFSPLLQYNVSVETFFILSGLLTTISLMRQLKKADSKPRCAMFGLYFFHRFWRLTPVYMLIMMVYAVFFPYMRTGPLYPEYVGEAENCKTDWWKHMIYLQNLIPAKPCMGWTWYLANDFQFYVIAPAFICLLFWVPVAGIVITVLGVAGSLASQAYILYTTDSWFNDFYVKPWTRSSTYLVGILLGYLMYKTNCKARMHKAVVVFLWILALGAILASQYSFHPFVTGEELPEIHRFYYEFLMRPAFTMGVFWIIFACVSGYGGIINSILSWNGWIPLAKLTYTGYLIHPIIIYYTYYSSPRQVIVTDFVMIYYFLGVLMLTLGASFLLSLFLEVPFVALEKVMFQNVKKY